MNEFKVKKGLIIQGSGSALLDIQGSQGQLFSITDSLEGSLFSVNDISGIPVMEVFSDDTINLGTFGDEAIKISGNIANITGSLFGTSSFATTAGSTSAVSGTTNFLSKFTGTSTLGNSLVFDNGTNVGIGTTAPVYTLDVSGSAGATVRFRGSGQSTVSLNDGTNENYIVGMSGQLRFAPSATTAMTILSGGNVGIGTTSPSEKLSVVGKISLNDGGASVFVGQDAGLNDDATNNRNVGIGFQSLYSNTTGFFNTAIGTFSLYSNTTGIYNTANGYQSLRSNTTGNQNTANGWASLFLNTTGNDNTANGFQSLYFNTTGFSNTANGWASLHSNTTGNFNTAIGREAGRYAGVSTANETGNNSVFLGYLTKANANGQINQIVIGSEATGIGSNTVTLGNDSIVTTALKGNVGIGTTAPKTSLQIGDTTGSNFITLSGGTTGTSYGTNWSFNNPGTNIYSQIQHDWDQRDSRGLQFNTQAGYRFTFNTIGNTGVYASNLVTILGTGNVGIGTTTPSEKLEVGGGDILIGNNSWYRVKSSSGTSQRVLGVDTSNTVYIGGIDTQLTTSVFRTAGVERMRITSTGNVGIGTTSPSQSKLVVDGTISIPRTEGYDFLETISGTFRAGIYSTNGEDSLGFNGLKFYVNNDKTVPAIGISSNKNVGIGTTNPQAKLDVREANRIMDGYGNINIFTTNAFAANLGGSIALGGATGGGTSPYPFAKIQGIKENAAAGFNGALILGTANTNSSISEKMRITSTGNVGIGTTIPSEKLEVNGNIRFSTGAILDSTTQLGAGQNDLTISTSDYIRLSAGGIEINGPIRATTTQPNLIFRNSGGSETVRITSAGNVGIGTTSPSSTLHLSTSNPSGLTIENTGVGGHKFLLGAGIGGSTQTGFNIQDVTTSSNVFYINNSGNVGIGTTNPSFKLDVSGTGRFTSTVTAPTFSGALSGNATTATTLQTARTLTIGNTGKTFNGGANVAWSLSEIGAQAVLTNPVTGTGLLNFLTKWDGNGTRNLINSLVYDNGTNVGIGTTSPSEKLSVVGKISLNDGGNSVFVGEGAGLNDDTTDNRNVGIGFQSLYSNTTGNLNTATGFQSLFFNTTGTNNTANGLLSLYFNTTGFSNTANGLLSLYSNTTGNFNTAIGRGAGRYAGVSTANQTGTNSVFLGYLTKANANGQTNQIVIGSEATGIGSNTVTLGNDSIVTTALKGNVGIGTTSPTTKLDVVGGIGVSRLSGIVFTGAAAEGSSIKTDASNTLIFSTTLPSVPYTETKTMFINGGNVGIGVSSPAKKLHISSTDQSTSRIQIQNTATGGGTFDLVAGAHNALQSGFSIFNSATTTTNFYVEDTGDVGIGNIFPAYRLDVTGTIRATGDVIAFSDIRVKENINTIENALEKVKQLRGIEYNKIGETKQNVGVVAQEVEKILPEVVYEDEKGMKSVAYGNIVGVLIEAIKEQQKQIDELKKLIK